MRGMDGEYRGHPCGRPDSRSQRAQQQKEQNAIRGMHQEAGQVVPPDLPAEDLEVEHMGHESSRLPVVRHCCEGDLQAAPGEAVGQDWIGPALQILVQGDASRREHLTEHEQNAGGQSDGYTQREAVPKNGIRDRDGRNQNRCVMFFRLGQSVTIIAIVQQMVRLIFC